MPKEDLEYKSSEYKSPEYKSSDHKNVEDKSIKYKNSEDKNLEDKNLVYKKLEDKNVEYRTSENKTLENKTLKDRNKVYEVIEDQKRLVWILALSLLLTGCGIFDTNKEPSIEKAVMTAQMTEGDIQEGQNPYADLSVPTYITKILDTYFIVDCYHNQVIYHDNLTDPLAEWQVMTSDMSMGHTIASDGIVYLVDDTENNRILIFEKEEGGFRGTQILSGVGKRPHYIVYEEVSRTFYVWSSMTGEMYLLHRDAGTNQIYVSDIKKIDRLDGVYVRSFTIEGDSIYFVSGTSSIIKADLKSFRIQEEYPVPGELAGMIQLQKIGNYYYITISTDAAGDQDYATIIRAKDLGKLAEGGYENVYDCFVSGGTPYYITYFDEAYYLTEHRVPGHSIWRFSVEEDEIVNVEAVY